MEMLYAFKKQILNLGLHFFSSYTIIILYIHPCPSSLSAVPSLHTLFPPVLVSSWSLLPLSRESLLGSSGAVAGENPPSTPDTPHLHTHVSVGQLKNALLQQTSSPAPSDRV